MKYPVAHKIALLVLLYTCLVISFPAGSAITQGKAIARPRHANIHKKEQIIKTYPFFDPNPIPSLAIDKNRFRYYPYFVWNGFSHQPEEQKWTVVHLKNPYIKLSVLPQVGGKIWGAIDRSTGNDFIYKNKVMKFRSIGIRGPWTSGGIEHNFGLGLGHAPWTASPVDYKIQKNKNGNVGIIVGGLDLASRTQWRVSIKLPKDKAYFETNSLWYNPTPLPQSYLSWENTAVHANQELQFFYPGQHYIGHDGEPYSWPVDKYGHNLDLYRNNDFRRLGHSGNKSYHVMGKYTDWYAAYWRDTNFGFGHWAPYTDAPGKKIWIWSLAPNGSIWKHLLTDNSGQYVELQSGMKFNQAVFGSGQKGPFDQLIFAPYRTDTKHEIWFPFKNTGGVVDASPYGVLNVTRDNTTLKVAVNALQTLHAPLTVKAGARAIYSKPLDLDPAEVYRTQVSLPAHPGVVHVTVGKHKLVYSSNPKAKNLQRPVTSPEVKAADKESPERLFRLAENEMSMRLYGKALQTYLRVLAKEPTHARALTRIAEIYYREGQYHKGLKYALRVLEQNTYDPGANFIYGVIQRRLEDLVDAKDGLSVASKSLKYRSGAYVQLASIFIQERNFKRTLVYANRALDYNKKNLDAYKMLAIAYRHLHEKAKAQKTLRQLLAIDPLDHFAQFEQYLLQPTVEKLSVFKSMIRNEFPEQTYLELAMTYVHADLSKEAIRVLRQAPPYPIIEYWLAYLEKDGSSQKSQNDLKRAVAMSPRFVFPFRLEILPVLKWAMRQGNSWKTKYYLGLVYWSKLRTQEAKKLFAQCGDTPTFAPFYVARGALFENANPAKAEREFKKAIQADKDQWRGWDALITLDNTNARYGNALNYGKRAYGRFSDNQIIGLDYATSLVNNRKYRKALFILKNVHVLPAEHARNGHRIYVQANVLSALKKMKDGDYNSAIKRLQAAKKWPENLGEGKPYSPDERLEEYLLALSNRQLGRSKQAVRLFRNITAYTEKHLTEWQPGNYVGALAFKALGQPNKAYQLLKAWREADDANSRLAQWALAKFKGKAKQVLRLERTLPSESQGEFRWSNGWGLLHQALHETKGS